MKKAVCKCLLACLLFVSAVVVINVPAYAKSSKKKVVMPKTVVMSYYNEEGELSSYTNNYTITYDKNGRVKKISAVSHITDSSWSYSITYKKSGKKTKAVVYYENSWGEDDEKLTYTFNNKGYLVSNHKSNKWEWDYQDDSKTTMMMGASDNYIIYFDEDGKYELVYYLKGEKATSLSYFQYEKGKWSSTRTQFYWDNAVSFATVTDEFLDKAETAFNEFNVKTSKVSMTNDVKWMNALLLFDFIFID